MTWIFIKEAWQMWWGIWRDGWTWIVPLAVIGTILLLLTGCITTASVYHECDPTTKVSLTRIDRDVLTQQVRMVDARCDADGSKVTVNDTTRTDARGVKAVGDAAGKAAGVAAKTAVGVP